MSTLYLVATPIGNLGDFSPRAAQTLRDARLIAAEDTRQTQKLLNAFDIHTPLSSYYQHNQRAKTEEILAALALGDAALVSDAGTPAINDPGYELVLAALQAGHSVSPIPGPSAPITALCAAGLPSESFLYLGYLPRRESERQAALLQVKSLPYTLLFLETPHRLLDSLESLLKNLGSRPLTVARELTKLHEEFVRGDVSSCLEHFRQTPPRGEFVLVVGGCPPQAPQRWEETRLLEAIRQSPAESVRDLANRLAAESGWPRREVYALITTARARD